MFYWTELNEIVWDALNFLQTVFITGQSESFLRVREVFKPTIQCMFKAEACFALPKENDPIVLKCG